MNKEPGRIGKNQNSVNRDMWDTLVKDFPPYDIDKIKNDKTHELLFNGKPTIMNRDKFAEFLKNDLQKNGIVRSAEIEAIENNLIGK